MTITERAATLSPYRRDLRERKVAENPGRKRAQVAQWLSFSSDGQFRKEPD